MCTIAGRINYSKADMITLGRNNPGINLKLTLKKGPIMLGHTCTGYFTSFIKQYWNKFTVRLYTDHLDCLALSSCNHFLIKWKIISNDQ